MPTRTRLTGLLLRLALALLLLLPAAPLLWPAPARAALDSDTYDGNIYALYAGNGSLVPPRSTLAQALGAGRPAVVVYYLDDDAASKRFAPVVSELQRLWGNSIELIPLVTDPLQNRADGGPGDPAHYWRGLTPQVVVFSGGGRVLLDAEGAVDLDVINEAVSEATGIPLPEAFRGGSSTVSINELNAEVVSGGGARR
ncbi:thylakoid membrane photosystem I accumulation factor [Cyanobium sp. CH-040]|uniref:thylakoid membrane photosystem I accumulation factor n=1 Tax=Cyanobium sp. CH-040 TaxID=2823708 RepID=UPI0020CDC708|nr:thylakoid membrane photosystem I accumulation factor [Cyanobium sp. CH-040]MCP9927526.1 thylakoid membrane photosystem I accumulation factor [Cyanobium sp. CH-040]